MIVNFLKLLFSQGVSSYSCRGFSEDKRQLDKISSLIQQRVNHLKDLGKDTSADPTLLRYYEIHSSIQECINKDNSVQLLLIVIVVAVVGTIIAARIWTLKKKK